MQVPCTHFVGIGQSDTGAATQLTGFQYVMQDQNAGTTDLYSVVIRSDNRGVPNCSGSGVRLSVGPLALPPGTGTIAFHLTSNLASPSTVAPRCDTYYLGIEFAASGAWPFDGAGVHIATYDTNDRAAPTAPNLGWECVGSQPSPALRARTMRLGALTRSAILNVGNVDRSWVGSCSKDRRSFGAGGLWPHYNPAAGRTDGLDARVRDVEHAGGGFALFLGRSSGCGSQALPGIARGSLYLSTVAPLEVVVFGDLNAVGQGIATIIQPGSRAGAAALGRFFDFQAVTLSPRAGQPLKLTNRASVNYR